MKTILTVFVFCIAMQAKAQYTEWLRSDRPGASMSPYTVGKSVLQIQGGYAYTQTEYDYWRPFYGPEYPIEEITESNHQESLKLQVGLTEWLEFSVAGSYTHYTRKFESNLPGFKNHNFEQVGMAFRGNFLKSKGYRPAIGLEARMFTPHPGGDTNEWYFASTLSVQELLTDKLAITGNVIYTAPGNLGFTLNAAYQIIERLGVFAEIAPNYALNADGKGNMDTRAAYLNGGASWYISRNFSVDLAGSFVLNDSHYFDNRFSSLKSYNSIRAGFTGRLDWRH